MATGKLAEYDRAVVKALAAADSLVGHLREMGEGAAAFGSVHDRNLYQARTVRDRLTAYMGHAAVAHRGDVAECNICPFGEQLVHNPCLLPVGVHGLVCVLRPGHTGDHSAMRID
jgi:hypothetical protein